MELMFIVGVLMCLVLMGQFVMFQRISDLRREYAETHAQVADAHENTHQEEDYLSDEQIARNQAFQERIERIKNELARGEQGNRSGYSADELHPNVKNLPHNTIEQSNSRIPDVEYAD